ncbi:MAG: alpha-amylase family glycosyl hydrolase [Candidatus Hodarchaeota archaeon]
MPIEHKPWLKNPKIYEINTWPWLDSLSEKFSSAISLKNIPDEIFNKYVNKFDAVWLMGVWERSPASKKIALEHPDLQKEFHKALHEFREDDVVGSPYAIYYYHVDKNIGGIDGIKKVRSQLSKRGIRLLLDYVPNHVSIDSLWTLDSNLFIKGTLEDLMNHPYNFFSLSEKVYAHGRDPNFIGGWTDTIQINAFSEEARQKTISTLLSIAELCDGVRCDMVMLMTNKVFNKTWGEKAGSIPEKEFWEEIIPAVKEKFPHFLFIAEVYWDLEWELQQQGFDFCYDKRLYDRLSHGDVQNIRAHLDADWNYQSKLIRFIENHDEPRAITKFGEKRSCAAAIIAMTLPGARLIHEGQMEGFKIKLPVQLGRRQTEERNQDLFAFYQNLLRIIPGKDLSDAQWSICKIDPVGSDDPSFKNLISYIWWIDDIYFLVVVNYSTHFSKGHIKIDPIVYGSDNWIFIDLLNQRNYSYKGEDLSRYGLYVELPAWEGHVFEIKRK